MLEDGVRQEVMLDKFGGGGRGGRYKSEVGGYVGATPHLASVSIGETTCNKSKDIGRLNLWGLILAIVTRQKGQQVIKPDRDLIFEKQPLFLLTTIYGHMKMQFWSQKTWLYWDVLNLSL